MQWEWSLLIDDLSVRGVHVLSYLSIDDLDQREQQLPVHLPIAGEELVRVNELVAEQKEPADTTTAGAATTASTHTQRYR